MNVLILGILCLALVVFIPDDTNTKGDKKSHKSINRKPKNEKLDNGTIFLGNKPTKRTFQFLDVLIRKIKKLIGGK